MDKKLTKRQKEIEALRQIKNYVNNTLLPEILKQAQNTIKNPNIPEEWMMNDNFLVTKYVIDKFCEERPFQPTNKKEILQFEWMDKYKQ